MTLSLFGYGTLEISLVMEAVTGKSFNSTVAVLSDHARFLLQGETYPGIFRDYGSQVTGVREFHWNQTRRLSMGLSSR
jgi:hypothetical protein